MNKDIKLYYFDLGTIDESTAEYIVTDFTKWFENEYSKKLCKNKGKLFKCSITSNNDIMLYGIEYGNTELIIAKADIKKMADFDIFFEITDAIDKCKDILIDFVAKHKLILDVEPSGGLANYYIMSK